MPDTWGDHNGPPLISAISERRCSVSANPLWCLGHPAYLEVKEFNSTFYAQQYGVTNGKKVRVLALFWSCA
jgi:hypothetical protein